MNPTKQTGKESSVTRAMKLIATEGMTSKFQIKRIHKQIDRDSKKNGWSDALMDGMSPEWQWRLCTARLQLGFLDWKGWEWRDPRPIRKDLPLWRGQRGKVLLHAEQGIGDEIMFSQCLPELLKNDIELYWECDPRLKGIFQRSFPKATVGVDVNDDYDFRLPMGHLAKLYRTKKESFTKGQYLTPDPEKVDYWESWLLGKPKVGCSWKGRQFNCEPTDLLEEAINLQYGNHVYFTNPPIDLTNDLEDVFALIYNLEKVVCVPTTVLHIAGSLGIPVDTVMTGVGRIEEGKQVNNALNWRFGLGSKMYWHESVTIYRSLNDYNNRPLRAIPRKTG